MAAVCGFDRVGSKHYGSPLSLIASSAWGPNSEAQNPKPPGMSSHDAAFKDLLQWLCVTV